MEVWCRVTSNIHPILSRFREPRNPTPIDSLARILPAGDMYLCEIHKWGEEVAAF